MNLQSLQDIGLINPSKITKCDLNEKVFSLLKQEFKENILNIKTMPETDFMKKLKLTLNDLYNSFFPNDLLENDLFAIALQEAEKRLYNECYKPILTEINKAIAVYEKKNKAKSVDGVTLLTSFHKHCMRNCVAYHSCKNLGRFINVYLNLSIEYVICSKCLLVYQKEFIPMYCDSCNVYFYSSYQTTIEQRCYPVTWSRYHCKGVIPEQMRCLNCKSKLWLSKGNFLCCKQCKSFNSPNEIEWKCKACLSSFRIKDNEIKEFNPVEAILIKLSIKKAIMGKQLAIPTKILCNCIEEKQETTYYHSKDCHDTLFNGKLNGCNIIVCNSCHRYFKNTHEFNWICSCCNVEFASLSNHFSNNPQTDDEMKQRKKNISIIDFTHYSLTSLTPMKEEREKEREEDTANPLFEDFITEHNFSKIQSHSNEKSFSSKKAYHDLCSPQKLFVNNTPIKVNLNETKYSFITNLTSNNVTINLNNSTLSMPHGNKTKNLNKKEYSVIVPKKNKKIPNAFDSYFYRQASIDLTKEEIFDKQRRTFLPPKEPNDELKHEKESIATQIKIVSIDNFNIDIELDSAMKSFAVHDESGKQYTLKICQDNNVMASIEKMLKQLEHIQDGSLVTIVGQEKQKSKLSVLLEHIESTLSKDINVMIKSNRFFTQSELQALAYCLVWALIFSQKNKVNLTKICPQNIMKTSSGYKLLPDQLSIFDTEDGDDVFSQLKEGKIIKLAFCVLYASTMSVELTNDIIETEDPNEKLFKLHTNLRQRYKHEFINSISHLMAFTSKNDLTIRALEEIASLFE